MKTIKRLLFPVLLVAACVIVHCWQHAVNNLLLPYLLHNEIIPLAIMSPALLALTFFASYVMLKQSDTKKPILRSFLSLGAMLLIVLAVALVFLSHTATRYAGVLPVPVLPDLPVGTTMTVLTALFVLHLTGLLIVRLIKEKPGSRRIVLSVIGWVLLNAFLFLITT